MVRNIIFDWSGTLVDDLPPTLDATNAVLEAFGVAPLDRESFREKFRLPYLEFYAELLGDHLGGPGEGEGGDRERLEAVYHDAFRSSVEKVTPLPGALQFVQECRKRGMKAFVLTAIHPDYFHSQAEELGFSGCFDAVYAGVVDKRADIHRLIDEQGLSAHETAFVGDMVHDVEAAEAAGVQSVAVLTGYDTLEKLSPSKPTHIATDLQALGGWLGDAGTARPYPLATVGALLTRDDGKVLLVRTHKWSGLWGIPGGKIERGETCEDALRREMSEETGLAIEGIEFVMVQDCVDPDEFLRPAHFLLLNYTARPVGHDVVLNDEAEEFRWVDPAEVLGMNLNKPTRVLVEAVFSRRENPLNC